MSLAFTENSALVFTATEPEPDRADRSPREIQRLKIGMSLFLFIMITVPIEVQRRGKIRVDR